MNNKVFNLVTSFDSAERTEKGISIQGMASTNDIDRAGDVILADAWRKGGLNNFKANPIILFNHNHNVPIGKATKVEPTDKGLEMAAFISKAAPNGIPDMIEEGVLGAFSVGFMVKDADYIEETGGLKIKDAELFEVSVVSVPANQAATFSLAKSFDSMEEYEEFKQSFKHNEDLSGQPGGGEVNASADAGSSEAGDETIADKEKIKMSNPDTDRGAQAQDVAEKAAAILAMKQAKEKADREAKEKADLAAKEALQAEVKAGVSGVEKLVKDLEAKLTEKDANFAEVIASLKNEIEEKANELKQLNQSKRKFIDRSNTGDVRQIIKANGQEFMNAHLYGVITGKGWNTDYAKEVFEKSGLDYDTDTASTGVIDLEVKDMIEKEIWVQTRVASLFREIPVNGRATVLPLQTDTDYAQWAINAPDGNLSNRNNPATDGATYKARSVTMLVDRLVSSTYIDDDVDEKTLVNLVPMLFDGVARAHARRVEAAIMYPSASGGTVAHVTDLEAAAAASGAVLTVGTDSASQTLIEARAAMGKYGLQPSDIAYIVSMPYYYELLADPEFQNLNEVGEIATKLRGVVGGVFGSPVIVSEEFPAQATNSIAAYVVNRPNYVIPRLRGVRVETDREVANQRNMIVASQSLGFTELFAGDGAGAEPVVSVAID